MRNLQVFREERVNLKLDDNREAERIVAATYDPEHFRIFLASDACCVYGINLLSEQDRLEISFLEPVGYGAPATVSEEDRVIRMEFLLEKEALALAMATGDILQLTPATQEVEVVGTVAGGIVSMALSPDGELLVVATGAGQLLLMTQDWDVLYEFSLNELPGSSTSGLIPPGGVQISWRGDGKYFATLASYDNSMSEGQKGTTSSVKVWERETGALHSCGEPIASLQPALSWSSNGSRIATAFCRADNGKSPMGLFFERNGLKRDCFELLGPPTAKVDSLLWNSDSELLAVVLRCGDWDAVQVWNCNNYHWYLKQEWRFRPEEKVNLLWDPEKPLCIMLWTGFGCLRRITLCWKSSVIGGETSFVIDGNNLLVTPLFLSIIPPPMYTFKLNFVAPVQNVATLFENKSRCLVAAALADGSLSVITLPEVSTWRDLEDEELSALSVKSETVVDFCNIRHICLLSSNVLVGSLFHSDLQHEGEDGVLSNVRTSFLRTAVEQVISGRNDNLLEFKLWLSEGVPDPMRSKDAAIPEKWVLKLVSQTTVDKPIVAIASNPLNPSSEASQAEAFVQLADGSLALYSPREDVGTGRQTECKIFLKDVKFLSPSPWMHAVAHERHERVQAVLIGLDQSGMLHVNNQLVNSDCTSFSVHESFQGESEVKVTHLVFTTRLDTLHVINLEEIMSGGLSGEEISVSRLKVSGKGDGSVEKPPGVRKVKGDNTAEKTLKIRPMWERGSRLVATIGGTDVAVILQTIRGNLETIYPRGLVLGAIASALTQDKYQDAMILARRNRINLNTIVDYRGSEEFARNAAIFVKQVSNLSHITELIGALTKENVMESTYKNLIPVYKNSSWDVRNQVETATAGGSVVKNSKIPSPTMTNKVQGVLAAIRSALLKEVPDSTAREMCILTTHARSDPPELDAALERVRALREAEIKGIREGNITSLTATLSAEAAVRHLIWLTDADSVFNVALGLYDLHLAAIVASNAQRDPKEFLPLLEELGNMPSSHMRYSIDYRLGRYESALRNCAEMGEDHFEDCVKLLKANPALFATGLQLFKDPDKKKQILNAWGDHLLQEKKFEDSGATFCACFRFDRALDAYRLGGQWEYVMIMAGRLRKTPGETRELAVELRDELEAMGRPKEAAKIALDYLGDVEGSMRLLIDAHEWAEVARLGYSRNQQQFIDTQLQSALLECATSQVRELNESVEKVGKYLARFLALHQRRMLLSAKLRTDEEGQEAVDFDASSDISIASSNASGLSGLSAYTRGSSRGNTGSTTTSRGGRRVNKSKGGKIRAGSPGEEMALVEHLRGTALTATKLEEQRLLLHALLQLGHEGTARQLQRAISHFIDVQENAIRQAEEKLEEEQSKDQTMLQEREQVKSSSPNADVGTKDVQWKWEVLKEQ